MSKKVTLQKVLLIIGIVSVLAADVWAVLVDQVFSPLGWGLYFRQYILGIPLILLAGLALMGWCICTHSFRHALYVLAVAVGNVVFLGGLYARPFVFEGADVFGTDAYMWFGVCLWALWAIAAFIIICILGVFGILRRMR